jgi:hypothetical protein
MQSFVQTQSPSQSQSRQLSARNSRAPSGSHTPNSEVMAITSRSANANTSNGVILNENVTDELQQPPDTSNNNNVVVTIIPDENAVDGAGGAMM